MAMAMRVSSSEKVKRIFKQFDSNGDGGLNRKEITALLTAANRRVNFSDDHINDLLDEFFYSYSEYVDGVKGLTFDGLLRSYEEGAGDADHDFEALRLELGFDEEAEEKEGRVRNVSDEASSASVAEHRAVEWQKKLRAADRAVYSSHGIVFDDTWKLVDDLEILLKRMKKGKKLKDGNFDSHSDAGLCRDRELRRSSQFSSERRFIWEDSDEVFVKELGFLRIRADAAASVEEAFDGHMAIGRVLYDHQLFDEALVSFKRACELRPVDVRSLYKAGNCLYALCRYKEAKDEFQLALEAAEAGGNQWDYLLPQVNVNLGVALEVDGMVLSACEYYKEAVVLCPTHFRALKLLGSALFGVGEYRAAVEALEKAIFLKPDYADAYCDLASAFHAMGEDEKAIEVFQKAIELKPDHVNVLHNLGVLYMDLGKFQEASEMYTQVLAVRPNHWRAQLNKAASLLGAGEIEEAGKAFEEALKMTNRVELHDAMAHLTQLQKKKVKADEEGAFVIIEATKFKTANERTTLREDLASALQIQVFQRVTRLSRCDVELLQKEVSRIQGPVSYSRTGASEKSIWKLNLEQTLHRLLDFLKPEIFEGAVKAINKRILSVLDSTGSDRFDLGMFYAVLAPVCSGPPEKRKQVAYDVLLWRSVVDGVAPSQLRKADAVFYIKLLRAIYIPSNGTSEIHDEVQRDEDTSLIPFSEFLLMFDDRDRGFGILSTLMKLETGGRNRHGSCVCSVCRYPIIGSRFKETNSGFSLCNTCYSEGKVAASFKQEEYRFQEYVDELEAMKDKFACLTMQPNAAA